MFQDYIKTASGSLLINKWFTIINILGLALGLPAFLLVGALLLSFTTIAIIGCLGLFGLGAYAAEQRNREIGIRKVYGASISTLVTFFSKDFRKLVFISIIITTPLAWVVMQKWLQSFVYRNNIPWWILAPAGLGAILISFVTISSQSFKPTTAKPIDSLRSE